MSVSAMLLQLLQAFGITAAIFALTLLGALPLGLPVALGRMSKCAPLRWLMSAYISVMRGTPLMLQLMVVYYGPGLLFHVSLPDNWRFLAVIVAFVINYAAYFAEIYRGGIQSIDRGQYEAAQVLGYSRGQTFFRIILPQVVRRILPSVTNEVITLVKDTSLARVIAVYEIIWAGEAFIKSAGLIWPLFFTGLYYLLFSGVLTLLFGYLEKRLSYFRS